MQPVSSYGGRTFLIASGGDLSAHEGDVLHYAAEVPENKRRSACSSPTRSTTYARLMIFPDNSWQRFSWVVNRHFAPSSEPPAQVDGRGDYPIPRRTERRDRNCSLLIDNGARRQRCQQARSHSAILPGGHGHRETVRLLLRNHRRSQIHRRRQDPAAMARTIPRRSAIHRDHANAE